jgi:colanic acid biosynthesis glycosyl transferase WcaI
MSNKFLLISQVFYPDQVSTANLFTDLCSVLALGDSEVEVWSGQPSYTELKRQPEKVIYNGITIKYLPSTNFPKTNLLGRILNIITFTTSAGLKVLFSSDKEPVWTHTTPPFLGILLSFICSLKKRKFIYILLDIFPEGLVRLGKVSKRNPFIWLWHRLFIKALNRSTIIVVIGRDIGQFVESQCRESKVRIEYIPHWQNENLLFPVDFRNNRFVIEHGLENKFVVQYSGNMGLWNEIQTLGKAVKKNIEEVFFVFVGGGIRKKELFKEFSVSDQQNVIILPFQPNESFNNVLTASKAQLVTLRAGLEGMAVPCKIYGILAAGLPVIAMVPEQSEIAYIVKEENCGIVLDPSDLNGLLNAIGILKSDDNLRKMMGQNSRKSFEKKYTTRIIAGRYQTLLNELY